MDDATLEEYPFSALNGQDSLQSGASTALAFSLWKQKYFSLPISRRFDDSLLHRNFSCTEILTKSLPSCIIKLIDVKIEQITSQLREWINFLTTASLFYRNFPHVFPRCFHSIVFNLNGTICWKQTASNMVKLAQLTDFEKYKIACTYCLENDVRQIWPSVSQDPRVNRKDSDRFDMMKYWNMRMESKADSVTVGQRFRKSFERRNWAALEYFFDMMTDDDVIQKMSVFSGTRFSRWYEDFEFMGHILCKFNKDQARMFVHQQSGRLMVVLKGKNEHFLHLCEMVSNETCVFESTDVFPNTQYGSWTATFGPRDLNFMRCGRINQLLTEVWNSAPDDLKSLKLGTKKDVLSFSQCGH